MKDLSSAIEKEFESVETVTESLTAANMMSGSVPVYATPRMIAMMEFVSAKCIEPFLDPTECSVGTSVNVKHTAATPIGMKVTIKATVTSVEGRIVSFDVIAFDEKGLIGSGTHQRAVVTTERFLSKAMDKLN